MVLFKYTYDIETENGLKLELRSRCDGTLLTEKIILSALHCCRPSQKIVGLKHLNINTNKLAHLKEATVEAGTLIFSKQLDNGTSK